jgi:hypothetical protein
LGHSGANALRPGPKTTCGIGVSHRVLQPEKNKNYAIFRQITKIITFTFAFLALFWPKNGIFRDVVDSGQMGTWNQKSIFSMYKIQSSDHILRKKTKSEMSTCPLILRPRFFRFF